ncbi:MAG: helix-turn-helix transcriptional regulator [Oscillospiraceae bacterium]|nr:helix-turn-helix transcriptional regulator [Oscillospiraceae bacterium]
MYEFSQELDVSKSTLQDILKGGNTTLHTALHIAAHLNVPLSTLTGEVVPVEKLDALTALLSYFGWFERLRAEDQRAVASHIRAIMEVLQK